MNTNEILQIVLFFGLGIALTPMLGRFMFKVFTGEKTFLHPVLLPIEKLVYKLTGINPGEEMSWMKYLWAVVIMTTVGFVSLMVLLMTQKWLPYNPQGLDNLSWHLAFNTAWSFTCNADWQSYTGETTMSYFAQTVGLSVHQFLSGAGGIAVLVAVGRALKRASVKTIGNFWVDLTRCTLYLVIPLSVLWALPLMWQGVPQTWQPYVTANLVEPYTAQVPKVDDKGNPVTTSVPKTDDKGQQVKGADGKVVMVDQPVMVDQKVETQLIPIGPVASFESCKQIFTNGGGWYGVNSAHPLENPTPLSDFWEMLAIIVVPMAQVYMFGLLIGNKKHAWCLFAVMLALYVGSFGVAWWAESQPNPVVHNISPLLEGKEQRFGVMNSVLWGVSCTAIDNGSVNSMHDSWMPLAGLMPMWNILIGEIMFGGVGCGVYCMLFHVLIAVFLAGLMIGRTPEYLGKKLGAWEATWAVIGVLGPNAACLIPAAFYTLPPFAHYNEAAAGQKDVVLTSVRERFAALRDHYEIFTTLFAADARLSIFGAGLPLAEVTCPRSGRRLTLELYNRMHPRQTENEGELTLAVKDAASGITLAGLSFSLAHGPGGGKEIAIFGLQASADLRTRGLVRDVAKEMHGLRPKAFALWCVQQLAFLWQIERIWAVSDELKVSLYRRILDGLPGARPSPAGVPPTTAGAIRLRVKVASYDQFWRESDGRSLPDGGWELPLLPHIRTRPELKPSRRKQHEDRYHMLAGYRPALFAEAAMLTRPARPSARGLSLPVTLAPAATPACDPVHWLLSEREAMAPVVQAIDGYNPDGAEGPNRFGSTGLPPVLVINLDRSPERLARISARLADLGIPFHRIPAVDGDLLTEAERKLHYSAVLNRRLYHKPLTKGEIGCYLSHQRAWRWLLDHDVAQAVILEDDVMLGDDFRAVLRLLPTLTQPWDVIKLGSLSAKPVLVETPLGPYSLRSYAKTPISAFAQAVSRGGAEKLLRARARFARPVDVDLQHVWEAGLEIYGIEPYPVAVNPAEISEICRIGQRRKVRSRRLSFYRQRLQFAARQWRHNHRWRNWRLHDALTAPLPEPLAPVPHDALPV